MRKVSFSWKPSISGREKWRVGLFMVVPSRSGRTNRVRIMVRGLLLWLLGLAVAAYLAVTSAWYFMLEQRETNYVTWMDCILAPVRWEQIRQKRGEAYIDEGLAALEARRWSEAVLKIRTGLVRAPDHWRGRRNLGLFYLAAGQRNQGLEILLEGFRVGYPGRDAAELIFRGALLGEDYEVAHELIESALANTSPAAGRDREWLIDQKCRLLMQEKRYEDVLAWVAAQSLMTEVRHENKVIALIELKRFAEGWEALDHWSEGSGVLGGVRRLTVRIAREEGNLPLMREMLTEMKNLNVMEPHPWVFAVVQEYMAGQEAEAKAAMENYLIRFGSKVADILLLAKPLQQIEAWSLLDPLLEHAVERGYTGEVLRRLEIEVRVDRLQLDEAALLLETYAEEVGHLNERQMSWLTFNRQLVELLQRRDAPTRELLLKSLRATPYDLRFLRQLAIRLEAQELDVGALAVRELIHHRFPGSSNSMAEVERLRLAVGERAAPEFEIPPVADGEKLALDDLFTMADELPSDVAVALKSPRRFQMLTEELMAEQRWSEVDRMLRELRRTNPPWIGSVQDFVQLAEIELNVAEANWPSLIATLRFRLDGSIDRALEVMKLVRRLDEMGERDAAELALREVERRHADFPPVRRTRTDWDRADKPAAAEPKATPEASEPSPVLEVAE